MASTVLYCWILYLSVAALLIMTSIVLHRTWGVTLSPLGRFAGGSRGLSCWRICWSWSSSRFMGCVPNNSNWSPVTMLAELVLSPMVERSVYQMFLDRGSREFPIDGANYF